MTWALFFFCYQRGGGRGGLVQGGGASSQYRRAPCSGGTVFSAPHLVLLALLFGVISLPWRCCSSVPPLVLNFLVYLPFYRPSLSWLLSSLLTLNAAPQGYSSRFASMPLKAPRCSSALFLIAAPRPSIDRWPPQLGVALRRV